MNEFLTLKIDKNKDIDENFIKLLEKKRGKSFTDKEKEIAKNIDPFIRFVLLPLFMEDD